MFIWFPYKTPDLSECQYNTPLPESLSDFEHLGLSGSEHRYFLDSVPVGVPQIAGALESLHARLENQEIAAMGNIYCGSGMGKRKNVPENVK